MKGNRTPKITNDPAQANSARTDVYTLGKSILSEVLNEVAKVMTTVDIRVQAEIFTAVEGYVILRVELEMKSVNASNRQDTESVVPDPDQRDFSGFMEGLQITTSSSIISNSKLNKIDETPGNIAVEGGDLSVNEKNVDRQTRTHHTTKFRILQKKLWTFDENFSCYPIQFFVLFHPPQFILFPKIWQPHF